MKFVSSRELRINPGALWRRLAVAGDLVITSSGKPVGVLTFADEDSLEDVLAALRQRRAQAAAACLRRTAQGRGLDAVSPGAIERVIQKARRRERRAEAGADR